MWINMRTHGWHPKTGLNDMPTELLREIFLDIPSDFAKTLWSLSLVCKRFHQIIEAYLHPEYSLRNRDIDDPYDLIRKVTEKPELRRVVRYVKMTYNPPSRLEYIDASSLQLQSQVWPRQSIYFSKKGPARSDDEVQKLISDAALEEYAHVHDLANGLIEEDGDAGPALLLSYLPMVESIDMTLSNSMISQTRSKRHVLDLITTAAAPSSTIRSHQFSSLSHLRLILARKRGYVDGHLFRVPSLRKVYLSGVSFDVGPWGCPQYTSQITELHIYGIERDLLLPPFVLLSFAGLKALRLELRPILIDTSRALSDLFFLIDCQKHSLETLELFTNEKYGLKLRPIKDEKKRKIRRPYLAMPDWAPMPSFSGFTKLKSLSLTNAALVGVSPNGLAYWHDPPNITAAYLRNMLPQSLETLTHVIWEGREEQYVALLSDENQHLRSWGHVWEAIDSSLFLNLRRVEYLGYLYNSVIEDHRSLLWEKDNESN